MVTVMYVMYKLMYYLREYAYSIFAEYNPVIT